MWKKTSVSLWVTEKMNRDPRDFDFCDLPLFLHPFFVDIGLGDLLIGLVLYILLIIQSNPVFPIYTHLRNRLLPPLSSACESVIIPVARDPPEYAISRDTQ